MITLYHRTASANAAAILREGFRDATGYYLTSSLHSGVWLSDEPLDANEGAHGDTLLAVYCEVDETDLSAFEWIEEGKSFREFLMPAAWVNARSRIEVVDVDTVPSWAL